MKIVAIIEKGSDGYFSIHSEDHLGNSFFGGFGNSVAEAKEDFRTSIFEAIQEQRLDGRPVPDMSEMEVEYHYDIPSFFNSFDYFNVSKFAEYAGINESKMRAYKSGTSYPGERTMGKISKAVKSITTELLSAVL